MAEALVKMPGKAWVVTFAGAAINLCLGVLYAWSVWSSKLIVPKSPSGKFNEALIGHSLSGINAGWTYLSNAQAATPFSLYVVISALLMIPAGKFQDKFGPRLAVTLGGLFLAAGCILSGLMKSYAGLVIGFGIMGGIGVGFAYATTTPTALKWFGPHKRGLVAGLVVGGFGAAALYIAPLVRWLIADYGLSTSFIVLGIYFAVVVIIAGQLLALPPAGYVAPAPPVKAGQPGKSSVTTTDWPASEMLKTWQYYALVLMFIGTAQSGLLVIAFAAPLAAPVLGTAAFLLVAFGGAVNALGRVGTGLYSDKIGRANAFTVNCLVSALCLCLMPLVIGAQNILLLFLAVGIVYWQYGGGLALMPTFTADFFGLKNLGFDYGFVFIGYGLGFFMARLGGTIRDITGSLNFVFYISAAVLVVAVILARFTKRPTVAGELAPALE